MSAIGSGSRLEKTLRLRISGDYPRREQVKIVIDHRQPVNHTLALRLPDWCEGPHITLNGAPVAGYSRGAICIIISAGR